MSNRMGLSNSVSYVYQLSQNECKRILNLKLKALIDANDCQGQRCFFLPFFIHGLAGCTHFTQFSIVWHEKLVSFSFWNTSMKYAKWYIEYRVYSLVMYRYNLAYDFPNKTIK